MIFMGGTIRKNRKDKFDFFPAQRTQIDVDRIKLTLIHLAPLTKRPDAAAPNLILETENDVTIVGFILATDQRLEAVPRLDLDGFICAADETIAAFFREG